MSRTPRTRRAILAGLIATTTLATAACSSGDNAPTVDEPSFSAVSPTTAASSSAATSSAATSSSSSSASSTTATTATSGTTEASSSNSSTTEAPAAGGSFNAALDNGDGTYRLSPYPPGPGVVNDETVTFRNLEKQGFSRLEVTVGGDHMNGNMQYLLSDRPRDNELKLRLLGEDMAGEVIPSSCRVDFEVLDTNGIPVSLTESNVKNSCRGDWFDSSYGINLTQPGEFTLVAKIYQPGYEPLEIKQPILVFE